MRAGRLRHRVTIEALTISLDSEGETDESWADAFGMLSAEIMPLSGRELFAAQAVQSEVTTRIKIRYRPGVVASMRVVHRDTMYNIQSVVPDTDSGIRQLTLLCKSGVEVFNDIP